MKTHPIVKNLIEFVDDDPSRYFSYMDERRRKQNESAWLLVMAFFAGIGIVTVIAWLVVRLWK